MCVYIGGTLRSSAGGNTSWSQNKGKKEAREVLAILADKQFADGGVGVGVGRGEGGTHATVIVMEEHRVSNRVNRANHRISTEGQRRLAWREESAAP